MSILLSVHNLTKSYSERPLFSGLTFSIESGERIGLIGPNGAGKSTLLKILSGQVSADDGSVSPQRGLRLGFLEQVPQFATGTTVLGAILGFEPHAESEHQNEGTSDDWEKLLKAREWIAKLELDRFAEGLQVSTLSGGWRKRLALGRELVKDPDLLLMDEPTNHLDVESIEWLERFLARAAFSTLTITHDRAFLQEVSNRIIEIDPRHPEGLLSIKGNYAAYLTAKEQLMEAQEKREIKLSNTLRRETEWLRRGAKARTTKQEARIQRAEVLMEEVKELGVRNQSREAKLDFQGSDKNPKKLLEIKGISKAFGDHSLFNKVSIIFTPKTRLGLVGPNGSGKSTFIKVIQGVLSPDEGEVFRSEHLRIAYFDQSRESLDPDLSVLKTLCPHGEYVEFQNSKVHIRSYLDRFLFSRGQAEMAVGKLSGGEQSRLLIARLMLRPANLLILDEPTNDLDFPTLGVLEDCLQEFQGAIILVTHDRYFMDQIATSTLEFSLASPNKHEAGNLKSATPEPAAAAKKKKLSFKDQRELDTMEARIQEAEALLEQLEKNTTLPEYTTSGSKMAELASRMQATQGEIEKLYARWQTLTES